MTRRSPSLGGLVGVLAASAALAGCGAGAQSTTASSRSPALGGTDTSAGASGREAIAQGQPLPRPATPEEKYEYDANEGRCKDDHGTVRNVGTIDAYCAFPVRSNDFHLIEPAQQKELGGEEE
jgi:hypothetical protein